MATDWRVWPLVRAGLPLLLALTLLEVGGGLVLGRLEAQLLASPSLLVLVPVTVGTAGNLGSVLAARLSTAVHLGTVEFAPDDPVLAGNAVATVALGATVFPLVGLGAWTLATITATTRLAPETVVVVAATSGLVLAAVAVVVSLAATYAAYRLGLDPDDVVVPVVTNTCDVLGVVVLFLTVALVV